MKKKMMVMMVAMFLVLSGAGLLAAAAKDKGKKDKPARYPSRTEKTETLLKGKKRLNIFAELMCKGTRMHGDSTLLTGMNFGLTFNNKFSIGLAGYGKADSPAGLPGYGGFTLGYTFAHKKLLHLRVVALFGSGDGYNGLFYVFEPEVRLELSVSKVVMLGLGVSKVFTDNKWDGFRGFCLTGGIRFGR
ncbi:MAG: hypothetical protein GY765_30580 [bacterium]|nr:hypothetical protein [bacterium]